MNLSILIPCFNEVENVAKLQREFLPMVVALISAGQVGTLSTTQIEVIFVDDGSRDGTLAALCDTFADLAIPGLSFQFIQHQVNRGLGAALRSGFERAKGTVVVTTDCDGTYRFAEIPALLERLTADVDLVTASPYHPQGAVAGVPAYRLLLSRGSSAIYRILADYHVYTYTALFRAYRRELIESVPFYATDFLAGTELLVNAMRMGYGVAEYPTVLHARTFGVSKAKLMRTIIAHLRFQWHTLLPWHPYGVVIRGRDDTAYLYEEGRKRAFPTPESFASYGYQWQQIIQVSDQALTAIPNGPEMSFREGALLRGSGETVYIIEKEHKRPFVSARIFAGLGYRWQNVVQVPDFCLETMRSGSPIATTRTHPDGTLLRGSDETVYLLCFGKRCLIPSKRVFQSWGYRWEQIVQVTDPQLTSYPIGEAIAAQPTLWQSWRHPQRNALATPIQAVPA